MSGEPWINTYTGKKFYPLHPREEDVDIRDIAYVLSGEWRFGGHCSPRISVAQHSVYVSRYCKHQLAGLLHDASEAYLRDLNRPTKHARGMGGYRKAEEKIQKVIFSRFGLPWPIPEDVHVADNRVLATEVPVCMGGNVWTKLSRPYKDLVITPWDSEDANTIFLSTFYEYIRGEEVVHHPAND